MLDITTFLAYVFNFSSQSKNLRGNRSGLAAVLRGKNDKHIFIDSISNRQIFQDPDQHLPVPDAVRLLLRVLCLRVAEPAAGGGPPLRTARLPLLHGHRPPRRPRPLLSQGKDWIHQI